MQHLGYHRKLLWVDLTTRTSRVEERPEEWFRLYPGGGLLATALLLERTKPGIEPLGSENLLIFASSVVAGHPGAGLARFTAAAKSPLSGGIGETRCEGPWGTALKASGADAIIFTGVSQRPTAVLIEDAQAEFLDAGDLWGHPVGECVDRLEHRLGKDIHVAAIGPAGENRVRFASIVTDRAYQAMRMGMGAVMGSKRLKAVVLRGQHAPPPADPVKLQALSASYDQRIAQNPLTRWQKEPPGFSCWIYLHGMDAALCVNNFSRATIEGIERFKSDEFLKRFVGNGNCPGCSNDCIKFIHPLGGDDLDPRASGIHHEISDTMGLNLGITDLDWVLRANNFVNQQGLDPTSLGFTLSFAMELFETGVLDARDPQRTRFGDADSAGRLMRDIVQRQGLGNVLAEGTRIAAQKLGKGAARFAMHVKGLEMTCHEPRSQTNLALGYAVSPIGPRLDICEHDWDFDTQVGWEHSLHLSRTLGILERVPMNHLGPDKVRNFKALHTLWSGADALDFCIFAIAPTRLLSLPQMAEMLAAVTGWETSGYEIMRIGERRIHLMRWYNLREGLTAQEDTLPDRFFDEPIASGKRKGDVLDRAMFQQCVRTYYQMMGWDDRGRPSDATLLDHGLGWVLSGNESRP